MSKIQKKRIFICIILVFVGLNACWFFITTIKYKEFVKVLPKVRNGSYGMKKEDGYNYNVKKPGYLHYTGNLAVSNDTKGELLIIWPLISGGYNYGIRLQEDGKAYEIYVDENMNPIDKSDTYSVQNIKDHKAGVESLLSKANKMWKLK
ncbi:hypothetical protein [Clostridium bowmanii]|uniref:hypothetical protein n=1 Tax=Clostridium bowmanii TaxID=132925 RepID=UPI001C0C6A02|nr:hypothetical protein [Clostridium bowmanii]MBU3192281.1 hypothetical protein [Clostridium bowmanii]